MATVTKGKTFTNGELVTPAKLHDLVDSATVQNIVNADISPSAAIAGSKLADGSVGDTKLAPITTAGKVANSATTATSANTANAIVARDAGGNFVATEITGTADAVFNTIGIGLGGGNVPTNTAVGSNVMLSNTTGYGNTAVGVNAIAINSTGHSNTAVGNMALASNDFGARNTAVGQSALPSARSYGNTAVGYKALFSNTSAQYNTAVGEGALQSCVSGWSNAAVGVYALSSLTTYQNCAGLGSGAQVTGSNQNQIGDSGTTTYVYGTVQNRSDLRDKADIRDTRLGLEFIEALRPVDYRWDMREDYRPEAPERPSDDATDAEKAAYEAAKTKWLADVKLSNITRDGSKKRSRYHHGLIAQEVKAILDAKGIDFGGFQDHSIAGGDDVLSIGYDELIAPMIKAIQELSARVAALAR
jgi:hypothetical protein